MCPRHRHISESILQTEQECELPFCDRTPLPNNEAGTGDSWMPPQKVIEIFEEHGFIWGGKWIIWDNMHFEYRPEVILFNKFLQEKNIQN